LFYYLLSVNAVVIGFFVWRVTKNYQTILNPVGYFSGYYFLAAVFGPALYGAAGLFSGISDGALIRCSIYSTLYFAALGVAFLVPYSPLRRIFNWVFGILRPVELSNRSGWFARVGLFVQFLSCYIALMILSRAGLMWLTDSRSAYQYHRAAVGVWWSLCQAILMLLFICALFRPRRSLLSVLRITTAFAVIALFLGSKASALAYFVVALFFVQFCVRSLKTRSVLLFGFVLLICALALQLLQGTANGSIVQTLLYFDYFNHSAMFLDRFHEFGFRYGAVTLSDVWYFVPRALYPAKPFAYGQMTINELLFPGGAEESGFTAGFMQWSVGYADFGLAGVLLSGFVTGFIAKGAYEVFLDRKDIQSLALLAQLGLIYYVEIFPNAPFPLFIVWLALEIAFVRMLSAVSLCRGSKFRFVSFRGGRPKFVIRKQLV
jgi:hypothetical protein